MIKLIKAHPLLSILTAAFAVRLVAVIWSQGFIHSDDHFDTIAVAWDWFQGGLWAEDGYLRWKYHLSDEISRFPLYHLFLLAQMKLGQLVGLSSLGSMMYSIRFSHALLSLLPVGVIFVVVRQVTGSLRWALIGGLVVGFHFGLPFLGVRNLIEAVGGNIWIVALGFLYLYRRNQNIKWLYLAGLVAGLSWMIRFQLAFAIVPVPFLLWWESKRWQTALHFSLAVGVAILCSACADWWLLGRFAGSTIAYLSMNTGYGALYKTIPMLYPTLLILLLMPPLSVPALYATFRPTFFKKHAVLVGSSVSFLLIHWLHPHQQERFIFPILPAFLLIAVLAIWQYSKDRDFEIWSRRGWQWMVAASLALNLALLIPTTLAYGHKGIIEPLLWFEANAPKARVLFLQPNIKRWIPIEYAGNQFSRAYIRKWPHLQPFQADPTNSRQFDYFVIYPKRTADLPDYLDSLRACFGDLEPFFDIEPSGYDQTLHFLNPGHNDNYAAFVYRPTSIKQSAVIAGQFVESTIETTSKKTD